MTLAYQVSATLPGHWDAGLSVALAAGDAGEDDALVVVLRREYAMSVKRAAGHGELEARRRLVGLYEFGQPGLAPEPEAILRILIGDATGGDPALRYDLFETYLDGLCSADVDRERRCTG